MISTLSDSLCPPIIWMTIRTMDFLCHEWKMMCILRLSFLGFPQSLISVCVWWKWKAQNVFLLYTQNLLVNSCLEEHRRIGPIYSEVSVKCFWLGNALIHMLCIVGTQLRCKPGHRGSPWRLECITIIWGLEEGMLVSLRRVNGWFTSPYAVLCLHLPHAV